MIQVQRFEDMSPTGFLRVYQQQDGDLIVEVRSEDERWASVEFCMPMTGGGSSEHTHRALRQLMVAMAIDELQRKQHREDKDGSMAISHSSSVEDLQRLIDHERECNEATKLFEAIRRAEMCDDK